MKTGISARIETFIDTLGESSTGGFRSVPGGAVTLYGTCYALLTKYYLRSEEGVPSNVIEFISRCQEASTGYFVGPEVRNWDAKEAKGHDLEHVLLHLACTAIPCAKQFGMPIVYPLRFAHRFCDENILEKWLDSRDMRKAWLEGNNLLFVGQLLVYLRDFESHPRAEDALRLWFAWLDNAVDKNTGLWGTDGKCSPAAAVYGGYHQLLVYYHEKHKINSPKKLVDTVLALQNRDGGFRPQGNAGACEDVDSVDILVNVYKRIDYRRADIRNALRRCLSHILSTQNPDGGFPYNKDKKQSHMGIPATVAGPNVSTAFATWFRVHTIALCAEIIPDHPQLRKCTFRFSRYLSMGWHSSPDNWSLEVTLRQKILERLAIRWWSPVMSGG